MSAVPCRYCGSLRKVEQVFQPGDETGPDVWLNPPCWNCGAPRWEQGMDDDPIESQPPPSPAGTENQE